MAKRPVIGIISRTVPFYHENRPYPRYGVAISYCNAVEMAGGLPVILPMTQEKLVLEGTYGLLDGLLLPGGQDVNPALYGEDPHRDLDTVDPLRDTTETYLAQRALADDMPILGVCRGSQVLNVAAGGTLYQDVHAQLSKDCLKHFQDYSVEWACHGIKIEKDSRLHGIVGEEEVRVNSYHHQAVKDVAAAFKITARAADGVVEGIESEHHTFVVGVQWHPELMVKDMDFNLALFRSHVEAAGRYAAERAEA